MSLSTAPTCGGVALVVHCCSWYCQPPLVGHSNIFMFFAYMTLVCGVCLPRILSHCCTPRLFQGGGDIVFIPHLKLFLFVSYSYSLLLLLLLLYLFFHALSYGKYACAHVLFVVVVLLFVYLPVVCCSYLPFLAQSLLLLSTCPPNLSAALSFASSSLTYATRLAHWDEKICGLSSPAFCHHFSSPFPLPTQPCTALLSLSPTLSSFYYHLPFFSSCLIYHKIKVWRWSWDLEEKLGVWGQGDWGGWNRGSMGQAGREAGGRHGYPSFILFFFVFAWHALAFGTAYSGGSGRGSVSSLHRGRGWREVRQETGTGQRQGAAGIWHHAALLL